MATINDEGNVTVCCPDCDGALSTYEWRSSQGQLGVITSSHDHSHWGSVRLDFRLFRCAGCGRGGLGVIAYAGQYPGSYRELYSFYPEARDRLPLPKSVPPGIATEFREGEKCLEAGCIRAAAGMFRSVLDKTLRANGYKEKKGTTLEQQIDLAAGDGAITQARKRRAHDEIRVLGNDVLHDEWQEIPVEDVEASRHYCQRILEDFYDDRASVLGLLRSSGRTADEDKQPAESSEI
ncbi:DUF4145 domain-containing protein [Undibacterium sp. 14-3-2]|uniref:DUF4145 domain-containing protein n=1 Tax=Undibacterium sp. 14-3-2 TaxID=2800129 RepID=UPI0019064B11|nr:DUF4145 domain-containing protein [Undibacterium sp. 14-3-2]MBK1888718.1 DUF4145 domain-containing protein [Undibacterium sp. 14-3-2]